MPQSRLRLLAALAALAAAVFVAAVWSNRLSPMAPVASIDLVPGALGALDAIKQAVTGITDEASARAALPRLREQSAKLIDIRDVAEKSPPGVRTTLAARLAPLLPDLDARIAATLKAPGVEAVAGPLLRQIGERAKALAKA